MLIFDIETNGFLDETTVVHTLHILNDTTGERLRFNGGSFADGTPAPRDGTIEDGLRLLMEADAVCGHNIIKFDIPAIRKLYPWFQLKATCKVRDTMVWAKLRWPHLKQIDQAAIKKWKRPEGFGKYVGKHSLKAWGIRLGVLKGDYDGEWHSFTQEMESYAAQDPVTTKALLDKCREVEIAEEALELEHAVQAIIHLQERFGFAFNVEAATALEGVLRGRKAELEDRLRETFKPWYVPIRKHGQVVINSPKKRYSVKIEDDFGQVVKIMHEPGVEFTKLKLVSFNPASRPQIADRLIKLYDWIPVEFTDAGAPKVDETTLGSLDHIPAAKLLIDYLTVDKRLGQLADGDNAWLKMVRPNGRIHGAVDTLGAITRRMTHFKPNVAQVPSLVNAKGIVPFGKECRSLFMASTGTVLVGCDAEGLELRELGHYMAKFDGGSYADTVVNGNKDEGTDVHTVNQRLLRMNSRNGAKTWIYAYLYGAGLLKLGMIIYEDFTPAQREAFNAKHSAGPVREKATARLGLQAKKRVEEGLPALGQLQAQVKRLARRGYLKTHDGGLLRVRSAHSALNTLLQGGGAIVMKKALVLLYQALVERGFEPNLLTGEMLHPEGHRLGWVCNVHDEWQLEVSPAIADDIGQLSAECIRRAGEVFELRCPLAGAYDTGRTWADTH